MCIRDSQQIGVFAQQNLPAQAVRLDSGGQIHRVADHGVLACLLYTSDAADERSSVDLGGRRIIKKKNKREIE